MKKIFILLNLLIASVTLFGQHDLGKIADSLVAEGLRLYKSEMASWYGTDLFLKNYKNMENVGGYFSYADNDSAKCIFFSKGDTPKVIGTITFDASYNVKRAQVDVNERDFSNDENALYLNRAAALTAIKSDTLFKF